MVNRTKEFTNLRTKRKSITQSTTLRIHYIRTVNMKTWTEDTRTSGEKWLECRIIKARKEDEHGGDAAQRVL